MTALAAASLRRTIVAATLGLGLLPGCAELGMDWPVWPQEDKPPVIVEAEPPPPRVPVPTPELAEPEPQAPPDAQLAALPRITPPPRKPAPPPRAAAAPPPSDSAIDPAVLVGLDQKSLAKTLGEPSVKQEEAPAKVWRYTGDNCVFSVFFYLDIHDQTFRAVSFESGDKTDRTTDGKTSGKGGDDDAAKRCLAEILASYQPAP